MNSQEDVLLILRGGPDDLEVSQTSWQGFIFTAASPTDIVIRNSFVLICHIN